MSEVAQLDFSKLPGLPNGWAWSVPADFCSAVASGSTPAADKMFAGKGDVPFIKVYNLTHRGVLDFSTRPTFISRKAQSGPLKRSIVKPGDVLINIVGPPLGKVSLVSDEFPEWNINQAIVLFRPHPGISNKYLAYAFLTDSIMKGVTRLAKATVGQFNIGVSMCRNLFPVPIAPLNEQRRIVEALDELLSDLDAGVAALESVQSKLKHYRAAVLQAAVEGALTADWRAQHPKTEPASDLLRRILAERRRQWEEAQLEKFKASGKEPPKNWKAKYREPTPPDTTNLPALPEGWCWASTAQIGETQGGLQKSPSRAPIKNHYPYLRVANVHRGALDLDELQRFELTEAELNRLRLKMGDLLIVEGNGSRTEIGRCAMWRGEVADCVHQNHIIRLRPLVGVVSKYVDLFLNSPTGQKAIQWVASSTSGLYTLSVGKIDKLPLAVPHTNEQEAIVEAVENQLSVIEHLDADLAAKLKNAQALRQSILRHAFTGQLVPQDPSEEPASELLRRIIAEREESAQPAANAKLETKQAKLLELKPKRRAKALPNPRIRFL